MSARIAVNDLSDGTRLDLWRLDLHLAGDLLQHCPPRLASHAKGNRTKYVLTLPANRRPARLYVVLLGCCRDWKSPGMRRAGGLETRREVPTAHTAATPFGRHGGRPIRPTPAADTAATPSRLHGGRRSAADTAAHRAGRHVGDPSLQMPASVPRFGPCRQGSPLVHPRCATARPAWQLPCLSLVAFLAAAGAADREAGQPAAA